MESRGASTSRTNTRARITTLFDEWAKTRNAQAKYGLKSFAVAALVNREVYQDFAEWLTVGYFERRIFSELNSLRVYGENDSGNAIERNVTAAGECVKQK